MSKYTENRAIAEKMETLYGAKIKNTDREVSIRFNPVTDNLDINIESILNERKFTLWGDEGEALFLALKQLYE
jgi:hypothetical protein